MPLKVICSTVLHEFARPAFLDDPQLAVLDRDFEAAGGERAGEDDRARVLRNVDEAAAAVELPPNLLVLTLPCSSTSAMPRQVRSRPPPW